MTQSDVEYSLRNIIASYVRWLEITPTENTCGCEWIYRDGINPETNEPFSKVRTRGAVSMDCPVHTREGFLLGFLNYLKTDPEGMIVLALDIRQRKGIARELKAVARAVRGLGDVRPD